MGDRAADGCGHALFSVGAAHPLRAVDDHSLFIHRPVLCSRAIRLSRRRRTAHAGQTNRFRDRHRRHLLLALSVALCVRPASSDRLARRHFPGVSRIGPAVQPAALASYHTANHSGGTLFAAHQRDFARRFARLVQLDRIFYGADLSTSCDGCSGRVSVGGILFLFFPRYVTQTCGREQLANRTVLLHRRCAHAGAGVGAVAVGQSPALACVGAGHCGGRLLRAGARHFSEE